MRTYHLVEPGRILQAVSYFNQRAFFVILVGSDVAQFDCQFLYVGTKMVYCFQPVSKVTKNKKVRIPFIKSSKKGETMVVLLETAF